ncbi:MAG TPA: DUF1015 domain-containing protein [Gemmatimonadales bacterium]
MKKESLPPLVLPFRGERYAAADRLGALIAPPYDVISPDDRKRYAAADPHNIVHVMLPEAEGGGDRYTHAAALLHAWREQGAIRRDSAEAVYVLAQIFVTPGGERRTRVGMFAAVSAEPYDTRRVRPHEKTHAGPKADRLALLRATQTGLESIFLVAPDTDGGLAGALRRITDGSRRPDAVTELDGVQLMLWATAGEEAQRLAQLAGAGPLYIADGHHRFETAVAYRRENAAADRVLSFVASARDEGLVILPTHRVLFAPGHNVAALRGQWRPYFDIAEVPAAADPVAELARLGKDRTACVVVLPEGGYSLVLKPGAPLDGITDLGASPAARALDVAIVEALVVKPILAAGAATPTLTYTPDAAQAITAVRRGNATAAVLLNATRIEQVFAVADAGDVMPQKSTYFAPKVPSGLVLRPV